MSQHSNNKVIHSVHLNLQYFNTNLNAYSSSFSAYSKGTARVRSYARMVQPFLSFAQLFISSLLWAHFSSNHIVDLQPRIYYILIGVIFAHIAVSLPSLSTYLLPIHFSFHISLSLILHTSLFGSSFVFLSLSYPLHILQY